MNRVTQLPDAYRKDKYGNNYKILSLSGTAFDAFEADLQTAYNAQNIDTAYGPQLDMLGIKLNQPRGSLNDAQYRVLLKAKTNRDRCNGTFDGILKAIAYTFTGGDTSGVILKEGDHTVEIQNIPLENLMKAGMSGSQALRILKSLMPIGVSVSGIADGTFEFCAGAEPVTDSNAGFADDDQNTGGYFGMLIADASSDLPI